MPCAPNARSSGPSDTTPTATGGVIGGQTATIGFWQNPNGQNLVRALNGGATATQLGHWLAVTFPNMYASLDGMTNAGVPGSRTRLVWDPEFNVVLADEPTLDKELIS